MAALFMDIFELAVLTFMFVRGKNDAEFEGKFGPDGTAVKELESEIEKQDLKGYMNEKEINAMKSTREAE